MKIVIDVPKEQYEYLAKIANAGEEPLGYWERVVMRGTPLPKGHGRLIDADATIEIQSGTHFEVIVGKAKIEKRSIDELIKASNSEVPTIIPADGEEENK